MAKRNDEYLKDFLNEHYYYEVSMLYYSYTKLLKYNKISEQVDINMALENFLFHSRNLIEFYFYEQIKNKDYARAADFIPKDIWSKVGVEKTKHIKEVEKRSSKEVVHLTYQRMADAPPEKQWNWAQGYMDLIIITKKFLFHLPIKYCGQNINNLKENLIMSQRIPANNDKIIYS